MVNKPYKIIDSGEHWEIREFIDFSPEEMVWHRDNETRHVRLLEGDRIFIQFDNKAPQLMKIDAIYAIPKGMYHRVIADTPFKIKIMKMD